MAAGRLFGLARPSLFLLLGLYTFFQQRHEIDDFRGGSCFILNPA